MTDLEHRYHTDHVFKALVDSIRAMLHHHEFTPSEVRGAAVLACCMHEQSSPRVLVILEREAERLGLLRERPSPPPNPPLDPRSLER